jgi:hypothetical protein
VTPSIVNQFVHFFGQRFNRFGSFAFEYDLFKMFVQAHVRKGDFIRKDFPNQNSIGIDIRGKSIVFTEYHLGSHVPPRASQSGGIEIIGSLYPVLLFELLGQTKIKQAHIPAQIKGQVFRFEITKNDSVAVIIMMEKEQA